MCASLTNPTIQSTSVRLTCCITFLLLLFGSNIVIADEKAVNPLQLAIAEGPQAPIDGLPMEVAASGVEPPNLRKILYPTYARAPYNGDQWSFYASDVNAAGSPSWGSMSRYSNLFDRTLRSAEGYVVVRNAPEAASLDGNQFESNEQPEFQAVQPGFLPFYSGRG
ncbi:hypothetical protein M3Y94_00985200 [Aphelenchoides besseyi]|nr:hypothetical protein M3Y94_00985200 [Aphelenchoides besseyi]KAI6221095.1 hypothetical protein M3Y95_01004800 [Aphelenchoides besseyi]